MKRWMKRNTIIFTINWWAKQSSPAFLLITLAFLITSCKKDNDFNLGSKSSNGNTGTLFTDTVSLINKTFLINDSIISASASYMEFGGYSDPGYTGKVYAESYVTLSLRTQYVDYTGIQVDSAKLHLTYINHYGDSTAGQDIGIHQLTTQLDGSVPYRTNTNFVSYSPTLAGEITGFKPASHMIGNNRNTVAIPLTKAFGTSLLAYADDRSNYDFNSNFYGIVIRPKANSVGAVVNAIFSGSTIEYGVDTVNTRLCVYFKNGTKKDSAVFFLYRTPNFNKIIADRSGTPISSLQGTGQNISEAYTNQKCFIQSGTGIVTKVEMPGLTKFNTDGDSSIIINKAYLMVYLDETSNLNPFKPIVRLQMLQLNKDNTYKYNASGSLAYIQASGYNQQTGGVPSFDTITSTTKKYYQFDVTSYAQSIIYKQIANDGFIITPVLNSYSVNRSVVNSYNAAANPMRLQIYYTKVK